MLKMNITKKIGKRDYLFQIEGKNLFDVVEESQKLSFQDVSKCGVCNDDNLILDAHIAQAKYKYVKIKCLKCKAYLTFGQRQDNPDTFYLRRSEDGNLSWEKYKEEK